MEADFQRAIAGGEMSYEAQLKFREQQLADEEKSSIKDDDLISSLKKSIDSTKKLSRFEKIRTKYKNSLDDYVTGRGSIDAHIKILEDTLATEQDEAMRTEIRTLLSTARSTKTQIEINAVKNRATLATKDNSIPLLEKSIAEVRDKQAAATLVGNEDEVAAWGETLLALRTSKTKLQIDNSLNEMVFKINRYNLKSFDKLGLLGGEVSKSEIDMPIIYGGVRYDSQRAFWEDKRNDYIRTSYFTELEQELNDETAKIASSSKFGQVPIARIEAVNNFYNDLRGRPEFTIFADTVEQKRVAAVNKMATDLGDSIQSEFAATNDLAKAERAITAIETKFGIKLSREPFAKEIEARKTIAETVIEEAKPPVPVAPPAAPRAPIVPAPIKPPPTPTPAPVPTPTPPPPVAETPQFTPTGGIGSKSPDNKFVFTKEGWKPIETPTPPPVSSVAPAAPLTPTPAPTEKRVIIVQSGETLNAIAQRELGDASRWQELATESGQKFDEETAKKLQIGTRLIIPQ